MSIVGFGNILRAYSVLKRLEACPGFSLGKFCEDTNMNYDEVRHFITFCEKIQNNQIKIATLKQHLENYEVLAQDLINCCE